MFSDKLIIAYTVANNAGNENIRDTFYFAPVSNNYGVAERLYFICQYCGRRSRFLHLGNKHFKCRICANLNYTSQQTTKNSGMAADKMKKFLRDKFKVTEKLSPMGALEYKPERPKGMHRNTYRKLYEQLVRLKQEYVRQYSMSVKRLLKHSASGKIITK